MNISANYGYSPTVAISLFVGMLIGLLIIIMLGFKAIAVISERFQANRTRRHLSRHPSGGLAMGPSEGFSDWDPYSGWESGGFLSRAAGHDGLCNRGWDYEPGSFQDRALGHSADRCYGQDGISGQDWDYSWYG